MTTAYEELRQLNIARNNAILSALEIPFNAIATLNNEVSNKKARTKPSRSESDDKIPTRSSARLAKIKPSDVQALPDDWVEPDDSQRRERVHPGKRRAKYVIETNNPAHVAEIKAEEADYDGKNVGPSPDMPRRAQADTKSTSDSSRNLFAHVSSLQRILGERVPGGNVKAGVMQFVSPTCVPKFSKYTGVQEWRNAIFFMLNIMGGNTYSNTFKESGDGLDLCISYFLSDRTKPDAPIIQRIVRSAVTDFDAADKGDTKPSLHLFCRAAPGQASIKSSPGSGGVVDNFDYVYFGRLRYLRHNVAAAPIGFEFRLEDYAAMRDRAPFRQLIRLAKRPS